jgi:hypothetical protein
VTRRRRGQRVIVERSGRGESLLALFSGKPSALTRARPQQAG